MTKTEWLRHIDAVLGHEYTRADKDWLITHKRSGCPECQKRFKTNREIKASALAIVEEDGNEGVCLNCGNVQGNCEPDARNYKCEACGMMEVFGAEEIVGGLV